jgi:Fur family transcriptional regulator, ferric uptake regulator
MNNKLSLLLKKHGYSSTSARVTVFESLATREYPITMNELIKSVSSVVDRATVYRTIDIFEKTGVVSRIQIGWKYKLELSDMFLSHHHHITCSQCGQTESFHETELLLSELQSIATKKKYVLKTHMLELTGVCSNCDK